MLVSSVASNMGTEVNAGPSPGLPPPYREGGDLPPPRNLEIEYGYYCGAINVSYLILHVTEHTYVPSNCCLESLSQIVSEAI